MGIGAIIQVVFWLGYAVLVTIFLRPIAKHALAIYCTRARDKEKDEDRGKGAGRSKKKAHRVRVFLRNLESEPLDGGPYALRIELHPHARISDPVVRAGAKRFLINRSKLDRGVWEVFFQMMPPHDTWLFEMDAPSDKCKVSVALAQWSDDDQAKIAAWFAQEKKPESKDGKKDAGMDVKADSATKEETDGKDAKKREKPWLVKSGRRGMHRLETSSLVLGHDRPWAAAGSYVTPRWSAAVVLMALSISAYLLLSLMLLPAPDTCGVAQPGWTDCPLERMQAHLGWRDVGLCFGLVVLTLVSASRGLRRPFPIAQGYLEKSRVFDIDLSSIDVPEEKPQRRDDDAVQKPTVTEFVNNAGQAMT
jgi:hypothetical protein